MINNLVLVGCGHMGYAMLRPWVKGKAAARITVVTPERDTLHGLEAEGVMYAPGADAVQDADVVVFAVRPQILGDVLTGYQKLAGRSLFISIAAGKKLAFYEAGLGAGIRAGIRMVRAMPNLPAKYGEGATLLVKNAAATSADAALSEKLLGVLGKAAWLDNENLMDAATALSGCGPAYFYYLADQLAAVGAGLGLPADLSRDLARQTLLGSATLWRAENESAETLYRNIAVSGGMTEAALSVMQENDALKALLRKALEAAVARGKVLAGG